MITKKNLLAVGVAIVCCITVIWFSTTTQGESKTYEIQPRISVPQYKTDTVRAIDAYERLMERYMNMTEINSMRIDSDLKKMIKKLDSIDNKLNELSTRISRIEKTFGIIEYKPSENKKSEPKVSESKVPDEPLPIW